MSKFFEFERNSKDEFTFRFKIPKKGEVARTALKESLQAARAVLEAAAESLEQAEKEERVEKQRITKIQVN